MRFDILTLFPNTIQNACNFSIIKRALNENKIQINTVNPRDYTIDKHKKVDDTPYGGGAGMLLSCQPYLDALKSIEKKENSSVLLLSPKGKIFNQNLAKEFAKKEQLIIICGHYEGFDERIKIKSEAEEISIGDFVLTGGEFPALCIIDSITRLLKGVLGDDESAEYDSFFDGLLEHPHYTKPRKYEDLEVPEILLSGNHEKIKEWRRLQQFIVTKNKRPDLFEKFLKTELCKLDKRILKENNLF
ncbi:MAG: tRNA (guanosine(37)-N1)-methyltransferase TrmD [Candidatus Gastranaerophilales bacterium]|nr:tRNA (guanosine(37)-N1)-methyltransferase TrmD [Candidatus Gastranaerophilales bacterium]